MKRPLELIYIDRHHDVLKKQSVTTISRDLVHENISGIDENDEVYDSFFFKYHSFHITAP